MNISYFHKIDSIKSIKNKLFYKLFHIFIKNNFQKANTEDRLKIDATYRIIKEVRKYVDSQMRKELKILKIAIEKDNCM